MFHHHVKNIFLSAVSKVASDIRHFCLHPLCDFTRVKKLPPDKLIRFLVSEGSSSTKNELLDFFGMDVSSPSASAFCQQRAKLKPEALEAVLHEFNSSLFDAFPVRRYRFLAADGSDLTFFRGGPSDASEYVVSAGHSLNGFSSMHLNALYDLDTHTYEDAFIQPIHSKDEFAAFCHMVDRYVPPSHTRTVFIGDRGYPSYNTMAHVFNAGQFFLFRTKDITGKGMTRGLGLPQQDSFDEEVCVSIVRSNSRKNAATEGLRRFVGKDISFDFVEYGSADVYTMHFRVVRFPLGNDTHECLVTNLPADDFPPEELKQLYFKRWGIESAFRQLKYTIGLNNFHAKKPEYVKQEIWARLIAYNLIEIIASHAVPSNKGTKHVYQINFSAAAHICRIFLHLPVEKDLMDVMALIQKHLLPIRTERQFPRLQTAHFRKPRHFIYRAS